MSALLWLGAVGTFGIGDIATTAYGFEQGNPEAHPVFKRVYEEFGFNGLIASKILVIMFFYALYRYLDSPINRGIPLGLTVLGAIVVLWNLYVTL